MRQRIRQLCSKVFRNNDGAGFNGVIATASLFEADETFFLECLDRSDSNSEQVSDNILLSTTMGP